MNYYKKVSLKDQAKIIKKHFGITVSIKNPPQNISEELFVIPQWSKVASSYPEALQKVLDVLKSTRPFYNWREGKIDAAHLRESSLKGKVPEIISAQFGELHKGKSIKTVRESKAKNECLLGAYEVGMMLITHPDRLTKYEDLGIDCPGDEFAPGGDGVFSFAPVFDFDDGELEFFFNWADGAFEDYGSASFFLPQLLESGSLDPLENLTLAARVLDLERKMEKVLEVLNV